MSLLNLNEIYDPGGSGAVDGAGYYRNPAVATHVGVSGGPGVAVVGYVTIKIEVLHNYCCLAGVDCESQAPANRNGTCA
jgi:hypothetical protein